ncbi:MAG: DNA mismatch repair protein MutS [Filimonas sp.]|nr:DNA mismatch repair protein MutS [Filimonas sp.]
MQADKTTLSDLSIFNSEEELSILHHLDFTKTAGGRDWLRLLLSRPLDSIRQIEETQAVLKQMIAVYQNWPLKISNGTVMVIERFYDTAINDMPAHPNMFNSVSYKLLNGPDYSLTRYSVSHFIDFVQGMNNIIELLGDHDSPGMLQSIIHRVKQLLEYPQVREMLAHKKENKLTPPEILYYGNFARRHYKEQVYELINIYSKLDAYLSLATACVQYNYAFPTFVDNEKPAIAATKLFHPLLSTPVAYNIGLSQKENFLFLTGANMAGKSTFIKAVGVSIYLAHIGMGVPAETMSLTLFDGLLSNIQVADNIIKGESYFFNEVQRIRKTIEKISDGKKWLILIDELFKGTNVQDAMKCSTVVIEGLRKMQNALFILSTHLYEIGDDLRRYPNIQFRYFETEVQNDQLLFSYHLKEGISNDRLGYLILRNEGVVDMLEKL